MKTIAEEKYKITKLTVIKMFFIVWILDAVLKILYAIIFEYPTDSVSELSFVIWISISLVYLAVLIYLTKFLYSIKKVVVKP
jgi:hypothetical protein